MYPFSGVVSGILKTKVTDMKVGILTFPNSVSYGAVLQMYALQQAVKQLGHDARVINYHNAYMKQERHVGKHDMKGRMKKTARRVIHSRLYSNFRKFEREELNLMPARAFSDAQKLSQVGGDCGAVICGSDQVWNPDITGADLSYFLDFCGVNTRRVAYAPSFGIDQFPDAFCRTIQKELRQFHALSARETPGQRLTQELTEREVPLVVDPTLLLQAADWQALEHPHAAATGDYILYYTVLSSKTLWKQALALSKKTGMKIVAVGGNWLKKRKNQDDQVEYAVDIGPKQWLYLVRNARYVVTNSFHGTAFAINYRKDFYVEFSSKTNSRLVQIVGDLGLTDRVVGEVPIEPAAADYSAAEQVLPVMRQESWDYLSQALQ